MTEQKPQVETKINKQPTNLVINLDKIDNIAAYMSAIRSPERYNSQLPFVIVPKEMQVLNFESSMPHPSRIKKDIKFTDANSFISYVNEFKVGLKPRLLAKTNDQGMTLKCYFDYDLPGIHHPGSATENSVTPESVESAIPMWTDHSATLYMTYHPEYAQLRAAQKNFHDQENFALFIEENTHLFVKPTGADMLELAQDMKGFKNVSFKGSKRLSNGQTQIEWTENVTAMGKAGEIIVPDYLTLKTPIFEGLPAEEFQAAFRYRVGEDRKISFSFRLLTKLNERAAQDTVKEQVMHKTGIEVYGVAELDV